MGRVGNGMKVAEVEVVKEGWVDGRCRLVKEAMSWSAASMVDASRLRRMMAEANLQFVVKRGGVGFG